MLYYASVFTFFLYMAAITLLAGGAMQNMVREGHMVPFFIILAGYFLASFNCILEWKRNILKKKDSLLKEHFDINDAKALIFAIFGTLATFFLNNNLGMGPILGACVIGIFASLFLSHYQAIIYTGAAAGMASCSCIPNYLTVLIIGIITGVIWLGGKRVFSGFGGKMGATALMGTIITTLFFRSFRFSIDPQPFYLKIEMFIAFLIGVLLTYYIDHHFKTGKVLASSITGIFLLSALTIIFGNDTGLLLSGAAFTGSFIGMSAIDRFRRVSLLTLAGILGAIIYEFTSINFHGFGGKMGTTAFTSILILSGAIELYHLYFEKRMFRNKDRKPLAK